MSSLEIPLDALPYSFKCRLVDVMSPETLAEFRNVNSETEFLSRKRSTIVSELDTEMLEQKTQYYVTKEIDLTFVSIAEAEQVIPYIGGTYEEVTLDGKYTWRQALRFVTKHVTHCRCVNMEELPEEDEDEFLDQVCQIMAKREFYLSLRHFEISGEMYDKMNRACKDLKVNYNVADSFKYCRFGIWGYLSDDLYGFECVHSKIEV